MKYLGVVVLGPCFARRRLRVVVDGVDHHTQRFGAAYI